MVIVKSKKNAGMTFALIFNCFNLFQGLHVTQSSCDWKANIQKKQSYMNALHHLPRHSPQGLMLC